MEEEDNSKGRKSEAQGGSTGRSNEIPTNEFTVRRCRAARNSRRWKTMEDAA